MFPQDQEHQGDQIRGFGFTHEGSFDTTFRFHSLLGCSNVSFPGVNGAVLQAFALGGAPVRYTCAPPGSGVRVGLDRDPDGVLDADE